MKQKINLVWPNCISESTRCYGHFALGKSFGDVSKCPRDIICVEIAVSCIPVVVGSM